MINLMWMTAQKLRHLRKIGQIALLEVDALLLDLIMAMVLVEEVERDGDEGIVGGVGRKVN